ncbi:BA2930 family N-acetyltransferase [Paenibacillus sp. JCM 10914]|uniref:aminoglycoside N(3)-acetyltransferase n=1 Tax=Paenibacillus sp. JCM 10914 TaxID=1236974 RepID=UPI0003CC4F26|nr:AAC(3) family N-acetyltransferase [Paenibacillus sp. JCM 10914]GAE08186.1 aminoglycoside N3-acetyltransferase [Paenibacillus sp. JCM 10914]
MITERPITMSDMTEQLQMLGIQKGMTLLVHSSLKSLGGWVVGGAEAIIMALEEAVGEEGTIVMPTQSGNLTDPKTWRNPPADPKWWDLIRDETPPYHPYRSVTSGMGIIPEVYRKQEGVIRSHHPQVSFAARGRRAKEYMMSHPLSHSLSHGSPLGRLYDAGAYVLLLGTGHDTNTSFHLAEYQAEWKGKEKTTPQAPVRRAAGRTLWESFEDINYHSDDFEALGAAFEADCPEAYKRGKVEQADCVLADQRLMVDYAVQWLKSNR